MRPAVGACYSGSGISKNNLESCRLIEPVCKEAPDHGYGQYSVVLWNIARPDGMG
jgi:hypothetical protein